MAEVRRSPDEPIEKMLRKFKRKVKEEGTLMEVRNREFFEKPSEGKKKAKRAAVRRNLTEQAKDNW